jgi:hypothetical protein
MSAVIPSDLSHVSRRKQVQRPAHRPRLDQCSLLPECAPHIIGGQAVDTRCGCQFRRRHDLRVQATNPAHDRQKIATFDPFFKKVTLQPERQHLPPCQV